LRAAYGAKDVERSMNAAVVVLAQGTARTHMPLSGRTHHADERTLRIAVRTCLDDRMPLLSRDEYLGTMKEHPTRLEDGTTYPLDFWRYVDAIPAAELDGYDFSDRVVYAWDMGGATWQHLLIASDDEPHVYLVIVLDLKTLSVVGHHLLDLSLRYPME
jgi:hypothetical protein